MIIATVVISKIVSVCIGVAGITIASIISGKNLNLEITISKMKKEMKLTA